MKRRYFQCVKYGMELIFIVKSQICPQKIRYLGRRLQTQTESTKRTGSSLPPPSSSRRKSKSTSLRGTCWRFQVPSGALSPLAQQPRCVIKRLPSLFPHSTPRTTRSVAAAWFAEIDTNSKTRKQKGRKRISGGDGGVPARRRVISHFLLGSNYSATLLHTCGGTVP